MNLEVKQNYSLLISWSISIIATITSLYFSEVMKYSPCTLCWYQRFCMYPLNILIGLIIFKKQYKFIYISLIFSIIGLFTSIYHYSIQKIFVFSNNELTCGKNSCTADYLNWFDFITIPFLSLIAFSIILICSIMFIKNQKRNNL